MNISLLSALVVELIGFIYTFSALTLPSATIGRSYEPKIFPALLGICLLILGGVLIIQEILAMKKKTKEENSDNNMKFGDSEKKIAITVLNGVVYALLFNPIGYVFSTILFLMVELLTFGGKKALKKSILIAVLFSAIAYLIFDVGLGIYLPKSFLGIF